MVNEGSGSVKSLFKIFDFVIDYYAISLSNKEALYYMHENTVFFSCCLLSSYIKVFSNHRTCS